MSADDVPLREWLIGQFVERDKALVLQALEIERRLELANNAIRRADDERARVVSREVFDQFVKEYDARYRALEMWKAHIDGGMMLLRFGGLAGVAALILFLLRSAGVVK